jgi:hypothetical protein
LKKALAVLFTALFAVTAFCTMSMLGRSLLCAEVVAFIASLAGVVLVGALADARSFGPLRMLMVLGAVAFVPLKLSARVLCAIFG